MRKCSILALPLLLTGCLWDEKQEARPTQCFEIIKSEELQPILINKCTGETWMALRENLPLRDNQVTPSGVYSWYKIEISSQVNSVAGIEKSPPKK